MRNLLDWLETRLAQNTLVSVALLQTTLCPGPARNPANDGSSKHRSLIRAPGGLIIIVIVIITIIIIIIIIIIEI